MQVLHWQAHSHFLQWNSCSVDESSKQIYKTNSFDLWMYHMFQKCVWGKQWKYVWSRRSPHMFWLREVGVDGEREVSLSGKQSGETKKENEIGRILNQKLSPRNTSALNNNKKHETDIPRECAIWYNSLFPSTVFFNISK